MSSWTVNKCSLCGKEGKSGELNLGDVSLVIHAPDYPLTGENGKEVVNASWSKKYKLNSSITKKELCAECMLKLNLIFETPVKGDLKDFESLNAMRNSAPSTVEQLVTFIETLIKEKVWKAQDNQ